MKKSEKYKEIVKLFEKLAYKNDIGKVFSDTMLICAITLQNSVMKYVDNKRYLELEKIYLETINSYDKEEIEILTKIFASIIIELENAFSEKRVIDILGQLFHDLMLHNKFKGQFFTPQHIADFMGKISITDDEVKDKLSDKGYFTLGEPCCGSGVMVLGMVNTLIEEGINFQKQVLVFATDIDLKCVCMAYIQCTLYGIPAIITHGNTLSNETYSTWYTPSYLMQDWSNKKVVNSENDITKIANKVKEIVAVVDDETVLIKPAWETFDEMKAYAKEIARKAIKLNLSNDDIEKECYVIYKDCEILNCCIDLSKKFIEYMKDDNKFDEVKSYTNELQENWNNILISNEEDRVNECIDDNKKDNEEQLSLVI